MNKEFTPYEQALALKELGFDEPCFAKYTFIPEDEINWFTIPEQGITNKTTFGSSKNYNSKSFEEEGTISAPTFSQAFRWFREKYGLYHSVGLDNSLENDVNCDYQIINHNQSISEFETDFKSYEEAELACLKKLIEIVKTK
jgi:hypothetical protein